MDEILYSLGDLLVSQEEYAQRAQIGQIRQFLSGEDDSSMTFSVGNIAKKSLSRPTSSPAGPAPVHTPVGIGTPLSLEILAAYSGDVPSRSFLGGRRDILVASGVKAVHSYDAAQAAVNQIIEKANDKERYVPSAFRAGSPIVYYSPAMIDSTTVCTVQLVADSFDQSVFDQLSGLLGAASGLPVFAPASLYLMAGAYVTRIVGKLGEALLETDPFLKADLELRFDTPEVPTQLSRHWVLVNRADRSQFGEYKVAYLGAHLGFSLVHRSSDREYSGNAPYVIVQLDGKERSELQSFTATLASAATLGQFYRKKDTSGEVVDTIRDAMSAYNDLQFNRKAVKLMKEIAQMPAGEEKDAAQKRYDAYVANIVSDELQP